MSSHIIGSSAIDEPGRSRRLLTAISRSQGCILRKRLAAVSSRVIPVTAF